MRNKQVNTNGTCHSPCYDFSQLPRPSLLATKSQNLVNRKRTAVRISLVGLAVLVCLAFGAGSGDAQTMKIATQTTNPVRPPKPPKAPKHGPLVITCQSSGKAVLEFLVATASGG